MTTQQRREAVASLRSRGVSLRRSCVLSDISRSAVGYRSRRPSDERLLEKFEEVRKKHPCYGYRRVHRAISGGEKGVLNHKRVHRVWRENGLQHPAKKRRQRRGTKGQVPLKAAYANHVWTYDFMEDATRDGRKMRALTLIDEFGRRGLAFELRRSFKAQDVMAAMEGCFARFGVPAFLRSDNGPEFIARVIKDRLAQMGVQTHYIDPGSPWQNAFGESFNSTVRCEFFNRELFATLQEAQVRAQEWLHYYNAERLHTAIGYCTPHEYFERTASAHAIPLGALPPNPQGFPLAADPQADNANGATLIVSPHPCVFGPGPALGSLPSVALSSGRASSSIRPLVPP